MTDLPKKAKHRAVIATGRVVHKILQVIARGKHVALTDDHHGADGGRLTRLNQGGGESAVHVSGDGVLLLWAIQLDCHDAAFACGQDIHGMRHLGSAINPSNHRILTDFLSSATEEVRPLESEALNDWPPAGCSSAERDLRAFANHGSAMRSSSRNQP